MAVRIVSIIPPPSPAARAGVDASKSNAAMNTDFIAAYFTIILLPNVRYPAQQASRPMLRHIDCDLEELVKRVCGVLPLAFAVERLTPIYLVYALDTVSVEVGFPCYNCRTVAHLDLRGEHTQRVGGVYEHSVSSTKCKVM